MWPVTEETLLGTGRPTREIILDYFMEKKWDASSEGRTKSNG